MILFSRLLNYSEYKERTDIMNIKFDKILSSKSELEGVDRTNPNNVVTMLVHTLCNYNPDNTDEFYNMLQYLLGDFQPLSPLMKQSIKDRMLQNGKYKFIGKSYFNGAVPTNDYTPASYEVEVKENPYSRTEEGLIRFLIKSGGADSDRPITVRLAKDGNYYVWSDSFIGLLTDIRPMESTNPWA
jgi:hypothetical protein